MQEIIIYFTNIHLVRRCCVDTESACIHRSFGVFRKRWIVPFDPTHDVQGFSQLPELDATSKAPSAADYRYLRRSRKKIKKVYLLYLILNLSP